MKTTNCSHPIALAVALLLMPCGLASAEVVLDNLFPDPTLGMQIVQRVVGPDSWYATPITTDGAIYTLTEVTAQIEDFGAAGTLFMEVWSVDSGNFNPLASLARLSLVDANFPKVFTGSVSLSANTSYFIVTGVDNGGGQWKEDDNYADPFGPYYSVQSGSWSLSTIGVDVPQSMHSIDFGSTWTQGGPVSAPLRMSITATTFTAIFPRIDSVSPDPVPGSNSRQNFTIKGINFDANCTVTLRDITTGEIFPNRSQISHTTTAITLNPIFGTAPDKWSVEVINSVGESCGAYPFSVQAAAGFPIILTQPAGQLAKVGSNSTLSVVADGTQPLSYQWRINGVAITNAKSSTLSLSNIQKTNSGAYSVVVTNSSGSVVSRDAKLDVYSADPTAQPTPPVLESATQTLSSNQTTKPPPPSSAQLKVLV